MQRLRVLALVPVLLLACSNPSESESPVAVRLIVQDARAEPVTMHARLGRHQVALSAATGSERTQIAFPGTGARSVTVVLLAATGDTLGATTFEHSFDRGLHHSINATVGLRPTLWVACGGPVVRVPIRGETGADTLFVEHMGIPVGALC